MPRGRRASIHKLRASDRSVTPEPTTESGVTPGDALYDTPPPGGPPTNIGPRTRKKSSKYSEYYGPSRSRSHSRSETWTRRRRRNIQAVEQNSSVAPANDPPVPANDPPAPANDPPTNGPPTPANNPPMPVTSPPAPADDPPATRDNTRGTQPNSSHSRRHNKASIADPKTQAIKPIGKRPGTTRRPLSHSPSPGSTDCELEGIPIVTGQTPAGSRYTYIYETVPPHVFMQYAKNRLGPNADLENASTPTILQMLRIQEADQAAQVGSARRSTSIIMLSPEPVALGGGWHRDRTSTATPSMAINSSGGVSRVAKCRSDESGMSNSQLLKRQRATPPSAPVPAENTDTEPESDDFIVVPPSPTPAQPTPPSAPRVTLRQPCPVPNLAPRPNLPPLRGTHPPPPTREATASTVLDSAQPSTQSSQSLGDPALCNANPSTLPLVPRLDLPTRGPVHARLRNKLVRRTVDRLEVMACDEESEGGVDEMGETGTSNPPLTNDGENAPGPVRHRGEATTSYQKTRRSHLPSNPLAHSRPAAPLARPNSPSATQDSIFTMERAQAAQERERARALPRRTSVGQLQPRPRPSNTQVQSHSVAGMQEPSGTRNRRLDPVSAARADMMAYNQDVVEGRAPSAIEEATRHNRQQVGEVRPTVNRSANGLMEDNEEMVAHAEAFAAGTFPKPTRSRRRRNRKKKPLARDSTGLARQVLVVAKLYMFAYALQEGIYQNRATFHGWARKSHEDVWGLLLPGVDYVAATDGELEVMVNYIATLRGKIKERLRPVAVEVHGFQHRITSQQDIEDNLDRFNLAHPNSFHCKSYSPRRGHYESPNIPRMIGAALFYGLTSVGVQFPEFFEEMPLTIVAFILAVWQFCLEEWSKGYFVAKELGAAHMLDKYEAQLAGLKDLRNVTPRRMAKLQREWYNYSEQYCGALWIPKHAAQEATSLRSEMRPDSPAPRCESEPELDYEEEEQQLMEEEQRLMEEVEEQMVREARIASLEKASCDNDRFLNQRLVESRPPSPDPMPLRYPSPPPPIEYNPDGRLTARSKGKGKGRMD
ncbi:hypothetical protein FRC06_002951 [Ceratobasidium sp. 370]|nr:hypothetical protein FRC06_002951 [Ceratobasidium sp. 370]